MQKLRLPSHQSFDVAVAARPWDSMSHESPLRLFSLEFHQLWRWRDSLVTALYTLLLSQSRRSGLCLLRRQLTIICPDRRTIANVKSMAQGLKASLSFALKYLNNGDSIASRPPHDWVWSISRGSGTCLTLLRRGLLSYCLYFKQHYFSYTSIIIIATVINSINYSLLFL